MKRAGRLIILKIYTKLYNQLITRKKKEKETNIPTFLLCLSIETFQFNLLIDFIEVIITVNKEFYFFFFYL